MPRAALANVEADYTKASECFSPTPPQFLGIAIARGSGLARQGITGLPQPHDPQFPVASQKTQSPLATAARLEISCEKPSGAGG